MGLATKILGCNGLCRRCYENRIRSVNLDRGYDIDAMLKALEKATLDVPKEQRHSSVCLHGGEPLMMKFEDLEKLVVKVHELYGYGSIMSNGTLIDTQVINLFKKYSIGVGISLDGDTAELNYGRWNMPDKDGNLLSMEAVQKMTDLVLDNMKQCKDAGLELSVIALLSKYNATKERLPKFIEFLLRLRDEFGVTFVRTNIAHICEEKDKEEEELTSEELGYAFCQLADVCFSDSRLYLQPYRDVVDGLFGYTSNLTCVFTQCDIWTTHAEQTIMSDGSIGGCLQGGAALDGIQVLISEGYGGERYRLLQQIPQEQGGCKDCRYWFMCHGGCPGAGIDDDWRNRIENCSAWKTLYSHVEKKIKGLIPNFYTLPEFYPQFPSPSIVQSSLGDGGSTWSLNQKKDLEKLKKQCLSHVEPPTSAQGYGDKPHGDKPHGHVPHGDKVYGDKPYGDKPHGDKPHNHAPHGDALPVDKSQVREDESSRYSLQDKPPGNRLHNHIPHGDIPYGDKPHGDGG